MTPAKPSNRPMNRWCAARAMAAVSSLIAIAIGCATPAQASLSCTVSGAVNFGTYDPTALSPRLSQGSVDMRCSCTFLDCVALPYTIEIQGGSWGTVADRQMKHTVTSEKLRYSL